MNNISHAKMLHVSEIAGVCSSDWIDIVFPGDGVAVYAMDTFFMGIVHYKN